VRARYRPAVVDDRPARAHEGERVTLADGAELVIRPLAPTDAPDLVRGLQHLSPLSRYRRFLGPHPGFTAKELRYLTDVDHVDHEALAAREPESDEAVGVARYVRIAGTARAEIAVTVDDEWQGRGVGSLLLDRLAARAREAGITRLTGLMFADNKPMLALFSRFGEPVVAPFGPGTVEVAVDLEG
jgi:GNAT superfamily N-acetyltransferase